MLMDNFEFQDFSGKKWLYIKISDLKIGDEEQARFSHHYNPLTSPAFYQQV